LYLIELFRSTLLPASFFGFFTTSAAILFSGTVGSYVDSIPRLTLVRLCIVTQKVSAGIAYALILLLFLLRPLREGAEQGRSAPAPVWLIFSGVVLMGCVLKLSTIGISIAVERDWITTIADGDERRLGMLNTLIRRIDLISKLVAPLFVSMLTTTISYSWSVKILLGLAVTTLIFEYWCEDVLRLFILLVLTIYKGIGIVYNKLPTLSHPRSGGEQLTAEPSPVPPPVTRKSSPTRRLLAALQKQYRHWLEFIRHPIFPSSLAISALYMTVLSWVRHLSRSSDLLNYLGSISFDGAMVSYLKTHSYEDAFIAGMRGVAVVAGLAGTIAMPLMEKKLGLIRAGNWSIWWVQPILARYNVTQIVQGVKLCRLYQHS
jgi:solute carrier family 40 (iron-regulated transporter), member 1